MSRYQPSGDYNGPPPTRWDADRFAREQEYRRSEDYYVPTAPPPRRARPVYEEERVYYEDDRYGPRGTQMERAYFEEEDYYDPRAPRGQLVPMRRANRPMQEAPPRPGLLRRQSSLDTFDRPGTRRYDDHDAYRPPPRPQRVNMEIAERGSPQSNRYRPSGHARPDNYDYDYREYYDDVAIQDPDFYGDEGFREFREREWVRHRSRDNSESRSRSRTRPPPGRGSREEVKEERIDIKKEEVKKEKTFPRRGKTKMPKRLVHTKALFDLGYSYYEEGEKTLIIEKALGPDNIEEVFELSRQYRERESSTKLLAIGPPPTAVGSISLKSPSSHGPKSAPAPAPSRSRKSMSSVQEDVRAEIIRESDVRTVPLSEAPRSVRNWDQLKVESEERDRRKSTTGRSSEVDRETIIEKRSTVVEREPDPAPRRRRRKSRRRAASVSSSSSSEETEIIKRKIITEEDNVPIESDSIAVGPLALVVDRNRERRQDREVKEKIRQLEAEQRALRRERRDDRTTTEFVRIERRKESRSPSPFREVIIQRRSSPSPVREVIIGGRRSPSPFREVIIGGQRRSPSPFREILVERRRSPSPSPFRQIVVPHVRGRSPSPFAEIVRKEIRSISPIPVSHTGELIVEQREEDIIDVRKDRRARSFSRARAPSAGLIKSMLYTAT